MWISNPGLLLAAPLTDTIRIGITSIIGVSAFALGLQGFALVHCTRAERILALAAGILLIEPGLTTDIIGAFIISILIFLHYLNWLEVEILPPSSPRRGDHAKPVPGRPRVIAHSQWPKGIFPNFHSNTLTSLHPIY